MAAAEGWWQSRISGWSALHRKLPTPWELLKRSFADYRKYWRTIVGVTLLVTLPVAVLANYGVSPGGDTTTSAYLSFAQLIMNVALMYTVIELLHGRKVSLRQAYYAGTGALVRLVLVAVLLVLMSLLILLGVFIFGLGVIVPGVALTGGEQALLTVLAVIVAIPSVVLVTRGLWALYIIFETPKGPVEAVRASRELTKGKVVITLGRLLALVVFLVVLSIVPAVVLEALKGATHWAIFAVLLQIIISLIVLPLSNLYLYRYYQGLRQGRK